MLYHSVPVADVLAECKSDLRTGLSSAEAAARKAQYGPNALPEGKPPSLFRRFLSQFADFMIFVLFAAAALSFGISWYEGKPDYVEPAIILAIILLNACLGTIQEVRAEHSLLALKNLSTPKVPVLRDGKRCLLDSTDLVPGDILFLESGQLIPADGRLIEGVNLTVSEASLTGESLPVRKNASLQLPETCLPADRKNCVFSSTAITTGHGLCVVTGTGLNTEIGSIAEHLLRAKAPDTPLQQRLASVGKTLGLLCLAICAGVFFLGILQGYPAVTMLLTAVSLAVAAIPEGLPAVVTIMLSIGVERMVKKQAIIRRLPAVETLGSATYICSDKTGTLTQNRMTVVACLCDGEEHTLFSVRGNDVTIAPAKATELLHFASLCSNSDGTNGEPTENALVSAAKHFPMSNPPTLSRVYELPFSSERKAMAVVCKKGGEYLCIVKGAPDVLLRGCSAITHSYKVEEVQQAFAEKGLRMIAVAHRSLTEAEYRSLGRGEKEDLAWRTLMSGLTYDGTLALNDPPRPECYAAVAQCKRAGITPVMITGDHPVTAASIAKELGIDSDGGVITGTQLLGMSQEELETRVATCHVFARVQPEHKVRIVEALQHGGEVVAMTGDGINDAPALKQADIGCAMGKSGTDVAKQAADMILMDDNFATIVTAVREGRGIYDNIRKAIHFLLSCNAGEILLIVMTLLMGLPTPLAAIHLLWINLVTDSIPAIALALEPPEENVMRRPPIPYGASLFTRTTTCRIVLEGCLVAVLSLIAYIRYGTSCCFLVLACTELLHALNIKSDRSLFRSGLNGNPMLLWSIVLGITLQLACVCFGPLRQLFQAEALSRSALLYGLMLSCVQIVVVEVEKGFLALRRTRHKRA